MIVLVLFCTSTSFVLAQSYYHSPNDTLIANTELDNSVTMNITQIHPTNDTLYFHWNKLNVSMPIDWEASVCDNSNCYTSLIESGNMLPVLPGDDGLLLIHCTPHTNSGVGIIQYTIYEDKTQNQIDTLTWMIYVNELGIELIENTSKDYYFSQNALHFIPNKVKPLKITIWDHSGRKIIEYKNIQNEKIEFSTLENSFYFIEITYLNQTKFKQIWIQN
ncbi:MAG: T9SS type A sorting domain-containing protein [Bacteroidota bacterium]